jgi:hypothetical protein
VPGFKLAPFTPLSYRVPDVNRVLTLQNDPGVKSLQEALQEEEERRKFACQVLLGKGERARRFDQIMIQENFDKRDNL